jgi:hypothetical protein
LDMAFENIINSRSSGAQDRDGAAGKNSIPAQAS